MSVVQGLMITETPYSLQDFGRGFQIMNKGECILDTNVLKKGEAEFFVSLLNEAFQDGFHKCSVELMNHNEN